MQNRIQEIERLPTKSAKDENELAQLHVKQQQILASGRHITSQNVQEVQNLLFIRFLTLYRNFKSL